MKGSERKSRTFLDVGQEVETNDFFLDFSLKLNSEQKIGFYLHSKQH